MATIDDVYNRLTDIYNSVNNITGSGSNNSNSTGGNNSTGSGSNNVNRIEDIIKDNHKKFGGINNTFDRSMYKVDNFGRSLSNAGNLLGGKVGKSLSGFGTGLAKISPYFAAAMAALDLLSKSVRSFYETTNELQKIENEKAKLQTQRNIKLNTLAYKEQIDILQTEGNNILKRINFAAEIGTQGVNIANMKANNILSTHLDAITKGINDTAWESLSRKLDIDKAEEKKSLSEKYGGSKLENEINLAKQELSVRSTERYFEEEQTKLDALTKATQLQAEEYKTRKNHWFMQMMSNEQKASIGKSGQDFGAVQGLYTAGANNAGITGGLDALGGFGSFTDKQLHQQASVERDLTSRQNLLDSSEGLSKNINELRITNAKVSTDIVNTVLTATKSLEEIAIDGKYERKKSMLQFSHTIEKLAGELQKSLYESGYGKGLTSKQQLDAYNVSMQGIMENIANKTGLTHKEIMSMQNAYGSTTGRSITANGTDLMKGALLGRFSGDLNLPAELANSTEIFNMGMSDTLEKVNKIALQANKIGLDGRKYMKDLAKNLKMAQKYTFRGGVEGLMKMAKWAQNVRFDMTQLPTILDKLLDGGLEGAITQGAQLQVLGGNFAMGADPLAMMYEAIDDPEALAKRYAGMLKGMGTWNSKTGQVDFRGVSGLMIRQMAKITGLSVENLRNMASQDMKREKITASTSLSSDLDEDQKSALINKAYYKDNKWMVNTIDNGEMELSQVTSKNIKNVQADTFEGTIERSLGHIVSSLDLLTGATESGQLRLSKEITEGGDIDKEYQARRESWQKDFNENFNTYKENVLGRMSEVSKNFAETIIEDANGVEQIVTLEIGKVVEDLEGFRNDYNTTMQRIFAYLKQNGFVDTKDMVRNPGQGERTIAIGTGEKKGQYLNYSVAQLGKDGIITGYNKDGTYKIDNDRLVARFGRGYRVFNKWVSETDRTYNKNTDDYKSAYNNAPSYPKTSGDVAAELTSEAVNNGNYGQAMVYGFAAGASSMKDGILSSNGSSMLTSASNITPINDGSVQLAQSDPQDVALFAKTGGPFDTLFNGIFAKINEISSVLPRSMEYIMPLERIFNEISHSKDTANNSKIQIEPIKLIIEGKLDLGNSNGQSVDIINEVKNNPILLRTLTQLISESINKTINGGKSTYTGGIVLPKFN